MSGPTTSPRDPLRAMPSILAIRDVQRRWRRVASELRLTADELEQLLRLDPLAVLRGLRSANAPVFRGAEPVQSVQGVVRALGPAATLRLIDCAPLPLAGKAPLRALWRHAIATALAAEELARGSGVLPPETAHLLGLLHDLPQWLAQIDGELADPAASGDGEPAARQCAAWLAHWQLPASVIAPLAAWFGETAASTELEPIVALIGAAERLAELADFRHPSTSAEDVEAALLGSADKADLLAAQRLRRRVDGALRTFGLDPTIPDAEGGEAPADARFTINRQGSLDETVLNVLGCTRSERYLGIITALTAAAVRYGSYDRAFYARWNPTTHSLVLRCKADASARRLQLHQIQPTDDEVAALRQALHDERPAHLVAAFGNRTGLLAQLGSDDLLAVPMNRDFTTPAFLLLDRAMTLAPIVPERDVALAQTLGMTGSLLNENLLLRRRRQRAQKFAVIDPLTRLYNRRMGLVALEREVARTERSQRPLTVLMCDLDHFKHLNDTFGHLQGDHALRATADMLRQTLRRGDVICRYGGEEFLVVLADTSPDDATVLAARLFTAIEEEGKRLGLPVTVSIGLTSHRPGDTAETILHRADAALYASKGHGRNRFSADIDGLDDVPSDPPQLR